MPILTLPLYFRTLLVTESVDAETALRPEGPEECNIPHSHTHDHDHDHKPHKPKKEHQVDLHDVTGHSHDVVSGVLDDGNDVDTDLGTIFLEAGMYVPRHIFLAAFSFCPFCLLSCFLPPLSVHRLIFRHFYRLYLLLPLGMEREGLDGEVSESPGHVPMESPF